MSEQKTVSLFTIQQSLPIIGKDAQNPHFKSKYATYEHIMRRLRPIVTQYQIEITHSIRDNVLKTEITWPGADPLESQFPLPIGENNPQKMGSAISYGKRYNVCALLNLVIEGEDDDAETASETQQEPRREPQKQKATTDPLDALKRALSVDSNLPKAERAKKARAWWATQNTDPDVDMQGVAMIDEWEQAQ